MVYYDINTAYAAYNANPLILKLWAVLAGIGAVAALVWAIIRIFTKKDFVPLLVWIGGAVASLNEGNLDYLVHLQFPANNPGIVGSLYWAYGQSVPGYMPLAYSFFIAMMGYFCYTRFNKGCTKKEIWKLLVIMMLADALEAVGTATGAYIYHNNQPYTIFGFAAWNMWVNAIGMMFVGVLLYYFVPILKKWWQMLIIPLLVAFAFTAAWGALAWPVYDALNFTGPSAFGPVGAYLMVTFSAVLAAIACAGFATVLGTDSKWRIKRPSDQIARDMPVKMQGKTKVR